MIIKTALICIPVTALILKVYDFISLYLDYRVTDEVINNICEDYAQEIIESITMEVARKFEVIVDEQEAACTIKAEVTE